MNVSEPSLFEALRHLASITRLATDSKNPAIVQFACSAAASLIAAARWGGSDQQNLMDKAAHLSFEPEFYTNSIRVRWDWEN